MGPKWTDVTMSAILIVLFAVGCGVGLAIKAALETETMHHLTYWGVMLHAVLFAGVYLCKWARCPMWSVWLAITGANVAACIAAGMINIHIMDNAIVRDAERKYGLWVTHIGNFLIHYMPVILWNWFLFSSPWLAQFRPQPGTSAISVVSFLLYPCCIALLFLLTYAVSFRASREYNGDLDFELMAGWMIVILLPANTWHSAIYQSHVAATNPRHDVARVLRSD